MIELITVSFWNMVATLTSPAFAQGTVIEDFLGTLTPGKDGQSYSNVVAILIKAGNGLLALVLAVALLFLIFTGYQYITSLGNKQQAETAKNSLLYIIIGIFVVLGAYLVITTLGQEILKPEFLQKTQPNAF